MWSVWLLLHSVFQNRCTNLKIFKIRFPAPPYVSVLPEPNMPSNRMEYLTKCIVSIELYFCFLLEISIYPWFYSHSSCVSLLRSRSLQGSSGDILLFATFSSLWPFSYPHLPLILLELWSRLPFVSLVILLKRTVFAFNLLTGDLNDSRVLACQAGKHRWHFTWLRKSGTLGKRSICFPGFERAKRGPVLEVFFQIFPKFAVHMQ